MNIFSRRITRKRICPFIIPLPVTLFTGLFQKLNKIFIKNLKCTENYTAGEGGKEVTGSLPAQIPERGKYFLFRDINLFLA
jgi:hypothetical protein